MHFKNIVSHTSLFDTAVRTARHALTGRQDQHAGVLSRRDLQRIVAEMVG